MSNEVVAQELSAETKALLAQAARSAGEQEVSNVPFMSIKGKKFAVGDEKLGATLTCVILADAFDHAYYDRDYDPDVQMPPACAATGRVEAELEPDADVPVRQSEACANCPQNQFGSSKNGKGKACRNGRRLLVASVSGDGYVNFGDLAIINIPPTSLKAYSRYVKQLSTVHRLPVWSVVTQLGFDDDSAWPSVLHTRMGNVRGEDLEQIITNGTAYQEMVQIPYDFSGYEAPATVEAIAKKSKMSG
jgi:hypothetical protein